MANAILVLLAGVAGAAGVALSAMAAHQGGGNLATAAQFLLFHAPALLAIGLAARGRILIIAGFALALGLALFAGDLALRALAGQRLFAMAAPAGGSVMIIAWLAIAAGALTGRR
jgi:uncharacterized membrane protein YgdD (TMEM256/DUF423 family)